MTDLNFLYLNNINIKIMESSWWVVCWCDGINILAAVSSDNAGQQLMTSPDGIIWTTQSNWSNSMNIQFFLPSR